MPVVPPYQSPEYVRPATPSSPRFNLGSADMGEGLINRGAQAFAGGLFQVSQTLQQKKTKLDLVSEKLENDAHLRAGKMAAFEWRNDARGLVTDYLGRVSGDAEGITKEATAELEKRISEKNFESDVARDEFLRFVLPDASRWLDGLSSHEAQQAVTHATIIAEGLKTQAIENALQWHNDEQIIYNSEREIRDLNEELGEIKGIPKEMTDFTSAMEISQMWEGVINGLIVTDPELAQEFFLNQGKEGGRGVLTTEADMRVRLALVKSINEREVTALIEGVLMPEIQTGEMTLKQGLKKINEDYDPSDPNLTPMEQKNQSLLRALARDRLEARVEEYIHREEISLEARDTFFASEATSAASMPGEDRIKDTQALIAQIVDPEVRDAVTKTTRAIIQGRIYLTETDARDKLEKMMTDIRTAEDFKNFKLKGVALSDKDRKRFEEVQERMKEGFDQPVGYADLMTAAEIDQGLINRKGVSSSDEKRQELSYFRAAVLRVIDATELAPPGGGGPRKLTVPEVSTIIAEQTRVMRKGGLGKEFPWLPMKENVYEWRLLFGDEDNHRGQMNPNLPHLADVMVAQGYLAEGRREDFRRHADALAEAARLRGRTFDREDVLTTWERELELERKRQAKADVSVPAAATTSRNWNPNAPENKPHWSK